MDTDDLEPQKKRHEPPVLERMSVKELNDYVAELEAAIARAREVIKAKQQARGAADSVFRA